MGFASYYEDILDRLLDSDVSVSITSESPEVERLKSNIRNDVEEVLRLQTQLEAAWRASNVASKATPYDHEKAQRALVHLGEVTDKLIATSTRATQAALTLGLYEGETAQ